MSKLLTSYSYELKKLLLYTSAGDIIDLRKVFIEINMFQDIFSPCMTANIRIADAQEILSFFKLHGNEFIEMEFDKPTMNMPIRKIFRVYKISDRDIDTNIQNYTLHLCSEEMILSPQITFSKSYKGLSITKIVKDILKNQLKVSDKKIYNLTETDGNYDIIIPRLNPLEAIQWLGTRAFSQNGSLYFFFENKDGFNFISYQDLLKQQPYDTFHMKVKLSNEPIENMHAYTFVKIIEDFDIMKASRYGSFSSSLGVLDLITKTYNKFYFNSVQSKNKGILNKEVTMNGFKNRNGKTFYDSYTNMEKFVMVTDSDPTNNPMRPENWLSQTASKLGQLHLFKMVATTPGDTAIKAGMIIISEVQKIMPQEEVAEISKTRTGKYLVSAVHHRIIGDIFTTTMELLSDSISDYMPIAINTSSKLREIISS
jgi:hypothetical protein